MSAPSYPAPTPGASLLVSLHLTQREVIVVGGSRLAASRAFAALEAGSEVLVLLEGDESSCNDEIKWRAEHGQLRLKTCSSVPQYLEQHLGPKISFVCITDTLIGSSKRSRASAKQIYDLCRSQNVAVNTADIPELCDFTFPSTHRFVDPSSGASTSLQLGVTTNGHGCRLASRLRRDIVGKLPNDVGVAVQKVGKMRHLAGYGEDAGFEEVEDEESASTPNRPVPMRSETESALERRKRRMKWVAQLSEYWSLQKLASMSEDEMKDVLSGSLPTSSNSHETPASTSQHGLSLTPPPATSKGRILLVGSGPGHPSLLTVATHKALTGLADLVLSDKLVPEQVLALIPSHVEVRIARKFPGNADGAQNELMEMAVEAAQQGRTVARLKQGDPSVYGRAGEEILYFRSHGFEPVVIPGVSSALAGPTFAGIPVTQRGVAESFIVCTGVGRKGKEVQLPGYDRSKTLIVLMGVARIGSVVDALTKIEEGTHRAGAAYPSHTPIAIIERAAMPDQRIIQSTLKDVERALESVGEQRPPGMIVIGWAAMCLWEQGDVEVLEKTGENVDKERVGKWLDGKDWRVVEGFGEEWKELL